MVLKGKRALAALPALPGAGPGGLLFFTAEKHRSTCRGSKRETGVFALAHRCGVHTLFVYS